MFGETSASFSTKICWFVHVRWGVPEILISDNGPPFFSEDFRSFSVQYGFLHVSTSPHYPQANGKRKVHAVKIAKRILKQTDPFLALMVYRATPIPATGVSPSQLIMGRQIRTTIPTLSRNLLPAWPDLSTVHEVDKKAKERYSHVYNNRHGVKSLSDLEPSQTVRVKNDNQKKGVRLELSVDMDLHQDHTLWKLQRGRRSGGKDDIFKLFLKQLLTTFLKTTFFKRFLKLFLRSIKKQANCQEEWQIEEIQKERYRIRLAISQADVLYVNENGTLKNIDIFQRY